jgi:hypothetical protein
LVQERMQSVKLVLGSLVEDAPARQIARLRFWLAFLLSPFGRKSALGRL